MSFYFGTWWPSKAATFRACYDVSGAGGMTLQKQQLLETTLKIIAFIVALAINWKLLFYTNLCRLSVVSVNMAEVPEIKKVRDSGRRP